MLFLNNAFTKDITEYDGEVLKEVKKDMSFIKVGEKNEEK